MLVVGHWILGQIYDKKGHKMKILSLQVGAPKQYDWNGRSIQSSMLKTAVSSLKVSLTNVEGDRFSNPQFHGTPDSVVYVMSKDTYTEMNNKLGLQLQPGQLGENVTVDTLDEQHIEIGDIYQIGEVVMEATGPRIPCEKINFVTQNANGQMAFVEIQRPGVYFKIIETGEINSADQLQPLKKSGSGLSVSELYKYISDLRIYKKCENPKRLTQILENPFLLPHLKESMTKHAMILKVMV